MKWPRRFAEAPAGSSAAQAIESWLLAKKATVRKPEQIVILNPSMRQNKEPKKTPEIHSRLFLGGSMCAAPAYSMRLRPGPASSPTGTSSHPFGHLFSATSRGSFGHPKTLERIALWAPVALSSLLTLAGALLALKQASLLAAGCLGAAVLNGCGQQQLLRRQHARSILGLFACQVNLSRQLTSGLPIDSLLRAHERVLGGLRAALCAAPAWERCGLWGWRAGALIALAFLAPKLAAGCSLLHTCWVAAQHLKSSSRVASCQQHQQALKVCCLEKSSPLDADLGLAALLRLSAGHLGLREQGPAILHRACRLSPTRAEELSQRLQGLLRPDPGLASLFQSCARHPLERDLLSAFCLHPSPQHFDALLASLRSCQRSTYSELPVRDLTDLLEQLSQQANSEQLEPLRRWLAERVARLWPDLDQRLGDRDRAAPLLGDLVALQNFLTQAASANADANRVESALRWISRQVERIQRRWPDAAVELAQQAAARILHRNDLDLHRLWTAFEQLPILFQRVLLERARLPTLSDDCGAMVLAHLFEGDRFGARRALAHTPESGTPLFLEFLGAAAPPQNAARWRREALLESYSLTEEFFLAESSGPGGEELPGRWSLERAIPFLSGALSRYFPQENHERTIDAFSFLHGLTSGDGPASQRALCLIAWTLHRLESRSPNGRLTGESLERVRVCLLQLRDAMHSCSGSWAGNLPQCYETIRADQGSTATWWGGRMAQQRMAIAMQTLDRWVARHAPLHYPLVRDQFSHAMNETRWLLAHPGRHESIGIPAVALPGASAGRPDWHLHRLPFWPRVIPVVREAVLAAQTLEAVATAFQEALNEPRQRARSVELAAEMAAELSRDEDRREVLQQQAQELLHEVRAQLLLERQRRPEAHPFEQLQTLPGAIQQLRQQLVAHQQAGRRPALQAALQSLNQHQGRLQSLRVRREQLLRWLGSEANERDEHPLLRPLWTWMDASSVPLQQAGFPTLWDAIDQLAIRRLVPMRELMERIYGWHEGHQSTLRRLARWLRLVSTPILPAALTHELARMRQEAEARQAIAPLFPNEHCSLRGALEGLVHLGFAQLEDED